MSDEATRALNVVSRNLRESAKDFERHGGFDYPVSAYERIRHGADEIDRLEAGNAELRESVSYEQRVNSDLRAEKSRLESELSVKTIENFALIAKLGESARELAKQRSLVEQLALERDNATELADRRAEQLDATTAERDTWRRRAEAAEADITALARRAIDGFQDTKFITPCRWCAEREQCDLLTNGMNTCFKWRGPEVEKE